MMGVEENWGEGGKALYYDRRGWVVGVLLV